MARSIFWTVLVSLLAWHSAGAAGLPVIPDPPALDRGAEAKVGLGKMLFFESRLSATKTVSCASCHSVSTKAAPGGGDGLPLSIGVRGLHAARNAPTVWNAGLRQALFWDGRARDLETQAEGPLLNPREMALPDRAAAVAVLEAIPAYQKEFRAVFGARRKGISFEEIVDAIAAYERTLLTPGSKFDRFQRGELHSMDPNAERGWRKFQAVGCITCHGAPTFQGSEAYIRFPLRDVPDLDRRYGFTKDEGRFRVTGEFKDLNQWRVPSLRNVAITAPYFHNGSVETLPEAVRIMGRAQLGKEINEEDVADIVEFLKSLTGEITPEIPPRLP